MLSPEGLYIFRFAASGLRLSVCFSCYIKYESFTLFVFLSLEKNIFLNLMNYKNSADIPSPFVGNSYAIDHPIIVLSVNN